MPLPPCPHQSTLCSLRPGSFHVPMGLLVLPCQGPGPQGWGEEGGQKRAVLSPPIHFLLQKVLKQPTGRGGSWGQVSLLVLALLPGSRWAASKPVSSYLQQSWGSGRCEGPYGHPCLSSRLHPPGPCPGREGPHLLPRPG